MKEKEFKARNDGILYIRLKRKPIWLTLWMERFGIRRKEILITVTGTNPSMEARVHVISKNYFMFNADFGPKVQVWFTRVVEGFEGGMLSDGLK